MTPIATCSSGSSAATPPVQGRLALVGLRDEAVIRPGNRFMVYALFPECHISAHVLWSLRKQNTVFAIGKSILDRSSPIDVGAVCLAHGGGGREAAGNLPNPERPGRGGKGGFRRRVVRESQSGQPPDTGQRKSTR